MKLQTQPMSDIETIVHIDFEEMADLDLEGERIEWNVSAAGVVCRWTAQTSGAMIAFTGILSELGEVPAWEFLADVASHAGFDVYNGDSFFEVYERSTVSDTGQKGEEMPRQTVEERIQKEIDKVDQKILNNTQERQELTRERDQLNKALEALASAPEKPSNG